MLDIVSRRTLLQLPHLPPQRLTLLDDWIKEDMAAAAAANGVHLDKLCTDQLSTKYSSYWTESNVSTLCHLH